MTPRRRLFLLGLLTVFVSTGLCLGALLAADLWAHHKFDTVAGLNRRGYRGSIVGRKAADEFRVIMLGGSTVFGYGVRWPEAVPALLEGELRRTTGRHVSVVNLGSNNEGAYGIRRTFEAFRSLGPDLAILYSGYNDIGMNRYPARDGSVLFRLTGYFPLLPTVVGEKLMVLRYGGDLTAAYAGKPTTFRPNLRARTMIGVLSAFTSTSEALARQLGTLSPDPNVRLPASSAGDGILRGYLENIESTVRAARSRGVAVLAVTQPYISNTHVQQQAALARHLAATFGHDLSVRYANLGRVVSLSDPRLTWDGMHLTAEGNAVIARALAAEVRKSIPDATTR